MRKQPINWRTNIFAMAQAVVINPMHMDCVIEMVLDHTEPPFLLPCLAVNKTWNRFGTPRMKKAGWRIHVTSERLEEYLRILEATEKERGGAGGLPAVYNNQDGRGRRRMDLCLHLRVYPGLGGMLDLETAMKIVRHSEAPKAVFLELDYVTSNHPYIAAEPNCVDELIDTMKDSIEQLTIRLNENLNIEWAEESLPHLSSTFTPLLSVIRVELSRSTCTLLLELIYEVLNNKPSLRQLDLVPITNTPKLPSGSSYLPIIPNIGLNIVDLYSLAMCRIGPSLSELNLHLDWFETLRILSTMSFEQLLILRVSSAKIGNVLNFVSHNCPNLKTLEFLNGGFGGMTYNDDDDLPQRLPTLKQLGFYYPIHRRRMSPNSHPHNSWLISELNILDFLRTMEICPTVTNVSTNLNTWTELAGKFIELDGRDGWTRRRLQARGEDAGVILLPPPFQRVWPSVTKLRVETPKSEVPPDPDGRQMHTVCFLIRQLFPNLTKLIIDLGLEMDSDSTYAMNAELDYVLGLGFGVPSLRHMEIQNFQHKWLTPRRGNEVNIGAPVQAGDTSALETLIIQGIPKSYQRCAANRYHRPRFSPDGLRTHELDLDALISILPEHCPSLLLKIDAQLLLNPSKSASVAYEQIVADLRARTTNPRIQLL